MTVDGKMNIRDVLDKFLSSLKINFTILPTAKIFATSDFTSKSIEIIRYFAGYFLYTATPLVVIAAVAFSNSSTFLCSDLKAPFLLNNDLPTNYYPEKLRTLDAVSGLLPSYDYIFTWLGHQIYVSPSYEQVFEKILTSSESNLTKELNMLNEFGFSPHCSNRLKELDPYEIFDSIQSPQTDDPYGPPLMEDIWWRGYSPMDRIIENKFENIFEALIEFESDERFPDTLDCLQRFYDVPSKTIRKDFAALKYLKQFDYDEYKNRKEKYESLFGQNFVQIFEIPENILLEPGSEHEFEEPERPEFEYIYENSPELKVKLAKGNFTHILSSPHNLTCKGYETCYEGSITNNQLCLPSFNDKAVTYPWIQIVVGLIITSVFFTVIDAVKPFGENSKLKVNNSKNITNIIGVLVYLIVFGFLYKDRLNKNLFCQLNPGEILCNPAYEKSDFFPHEILQTTCDFVDAERVGEQVPPAEKTTSMIRQLTVIGDQKCAIRPLSGAKIFIRKFKMTEEQTPSNFVYLNKEQMDEMLLMSLKPRKKGGAYRREILSEETYFQIHSNDATMIFYLLEDFPLREKPEKGILAFSEIMYQIDTHFISYEVEYNQSYVVKDGIQLKSVNLEPGFHMFYHKGYILYTSPYDESNEFDYLNMLSIDNELVKSKFMTTVPNVLSDNLGTFMFSAKGLLIQCGSNKGGCLFSEDVFQTTNYIFTDWDCTSWNCANGKEHWDRNLVKNLQDYPGENVIYNSIDELANNETRVSLKSAMAFRGVSRDQVSLYNNDFVFFDFFRMGSTNSLNLIPLRGRNRNWRKYDLVNQDPSFWDNTWGTILQILVISTSEKDWLFQLTPENDYWSLNRIHFLSDNAFELIFITKIFTGHSRYGYKILEFPSFIEGSHNDGKISATIYPNLISVEKSAVLNATDSFVVEDWEIDVFGNVANEERLVPRKLLGEGTFSTVYY